MRPELHIHTCSRRFSLKMTMWNRNGSNAAVTRGRKDNSQTCHLANLQLHIVLVFFQVVLNLFCSYCTAARLGNIQCVKKKEEKHVKHSKDFRENRLSGYKLTEIFVRHTGRKAAAIIGRPGRPPGEQLKPKSLRCHFRVSEVKT